MTERELRLRERIDALTDERDLYRARWERARDTLHRTRRALTVARQSRQMWRQRYRDLRRMSYAHVGAGRFRRMAG